MHDNPQPLSEPAFALPGHRVVALTGRDAAAFAHAQFMSDVRAIAPGQWHWSGWLTPKGRVIALFSLLELDDETLWLLVPDADPVAFAEGLKRFVFRSKVSIEVRDDLRAEGRFSAPAQARGNALSVEANGGVELDFGTPRAARTLRITSDSAASPDAQDEARWAMADLEHGLPRLPSSQATLWTPQQLSLERLQAFSIKKGCYPGQEIVARTHFLGKAKRGLILVEGPASLDVGAELRAADSALGTLIATAGADGRHLALAVGPIERATQPLTVDDQSVCETPLLDGLLR